MSEYRDDIAEGVFDQYEIPFDTDKIKSALKLQELVKENIFNFTKRMRATPDSEEGRKASKILAIRNYLQSLVEESES